MFFKIEKTYGSGKMESFAGRKIGITDTTLRDSHQSLLATRMKTEDMLPVAAQMDEMGFHSLEVWGGATLIPVCVSWGRILGKD